MTTTETLTSPTTAFDQRALRSFYGGMPSGVLALAAMVDGAPIGMAVSSFTNVSLDPRWWSCRFAANPARGRYSVRQR